MRSLASLLACTPCCSIRLATYTTALSAIMTRTSMKRNGDRLLSEMGHGRRCRRRGQIVRSSFKTRPLAAPRHTADECRLCCKSLKTRGDQSPARRPNKPRSLIDVASGSLPKSPVSLSPGDEVPHMFTRKPRLQLEKFAINGAKRLLQHNLPTADSCTAANSISIRSIRRR
jgi:hypothetical protein